MPRFTILDPSSGRSVRVTLSRMPTEAEIRYIFAHPQGKPPASIQSRVEDTVFPYRLIDALLSRRGVKDGEHSFSSTQVNLGLAEAAAILSMGANIQDNELADNGRETEPHITVRYGLHDDDAAAAQALIGGEPPVQVTFGATSVFHTEANGDVVKVDVESEDLERLNELLASLPHTDTHWKYKPHATVAYVKTGLGEKYAGNASLAGKTVTLDSLVFSSKDGKVTTIPLTGKKTN